MEYEQNFIQLRDRDEQITGMTKFFATLMLSLGSVIVGLLGIRQLNAKVQLVGMLLLATALVGEILFFWLVSFREYFVVCARQLNSLRRRYVELLPADSRVVAVQPTDPRYPKVLHWGSAQMWIWLFMLVLILLSAGAGTILLFGGFNALSGRPLFIAGAVMGAILALDATYVLRRDKKERAIVVDVDNTVLSDKQRKTAVLKQRFNKDVPLSALDGNYRLSGILDETQYQEFEKLFHDPRLVELDEPLPGCIEALRALARDYSIVYLTTRPARLRGSTLERLRALGLPLSKPLWRTLNMKKGERDSAREWKRKNLKRLLHKYEIVAGIGDAPSDCQAYADAGIIPVCIRSYWSPEEVRKEIGSVAERVAFVETWAEASLVVKDRNR
jgi:phosphoglycolate phosphatase-like HAD superfamily hydrolase